jgi:hypothetical protein
MQYKGAERNLWEINYDSICPLRDLICAHSLPGWRTVEYSQERVKWGTRWSIQHRKWRPTEKFEEES